MKYKIVVLPHAAREVRKLPPGGKRRVQAALEILAENPRPPVAKKLTARPEWRVRVGEFRVLYRIDDGILTVVVVSAGHRREVYR